MIFQLRPYQEEAKTEIRALFSNGVKRVILCKPTGSGKTVTFASIARDAVKMGSRIGIVVDRRELLDQAAKKLVAYGLKPQIIRGQTRINYNAKAFVATVQTLIKRPQPDLDLLIIDEAHKQTFDKLLDLEDYEDVFVIGATATPLRTGRMNQLSDYYQKLVEVIDIAELINEGFLVPATTYAPKDGADLSGVKTVRGDYDNRGMFDAFDRSPLYDGVVEKYRTFSDGDRAICFNINVEHSKKTAAAFNAQGVRAEHLDGSINEKRREEILRQWRAGVFDVLCNCDLFTTGFDEPTIETVIVNRATKSLPLWLQMCGRGSRIANGKEGFNIIDMGGNVFRLGFWEQPREYSLTHEYKTKTMDAPVKECDPIKEDQNNNYGCGAIVHLSASVCPECGFIFPKQKQKLIVAEFTKIDNKDAELPEEIRNKKYNEMTIAELEQVRAARKYNIGWLIHKVANRPDLTLEELREFKGYKKNWVKITRERLGIPEHQNA